VIKRLLRFKFIVIKLILMIVAIVRFVINIENKTVISYLLKEVLIIVILLIKSMATIFITAKEIAIRFILIKVILTGLI